MYRVINQFYGEIEQRLINVGEQIEVDAERAARMLAANVIEPIDKPSRKRVKANANDVKKG